jgi:YHS domain-containing protein
LFLGPDEASQHESAVKVGRGIDLAYRNKEVSAMAKDPVCAMEVDDQTVKWTSTYEGKRYSFCSDGCKESFDKEPDRYLLEGDLLGRKIKPH